MSESIGGPDAAFTVVGTCDPEKERPLRSLPIINRLIFITVPIAIAIFVLLGRINPDSHGSARTTTNCRTGELELSSSLWLRLVLAFTVLCLSLPRLRAAVSSVLTSILGIGCVVIGIAGGLAILAVIAVFIFLAIHTSR